MTTGARGRDSLVVDEAAPQIDRSDRSMARGSFPFFRRGFFLSRLALHLASFVSGIDRGVVLASFFRPSGCVYARLLRPSLSKLEMEEEEEERSTAKKKEKKLFPLFSTLSLLLSSASHARTKVSEV